MVDLLVDEGFAFDYLAILYVKMAQCSEPPSKFNYYRCYSNLIKQLGQEIFNKVLNSEEYNNLLIMNQRVFDTIELVRAGKNISSKQLDDLNTERWKAKKELQMKFFGCELSETKTLK